MKKYYLLLGLAAALLLIISCKKSPAELVKSWGSKGTGDGQFQYVEDFAVDAKGNILATDALNSNIQVFSPDGVFITKFGTKGT